MDLPEGRPVGRVIAMPADTNPEGDIFGGWVMANARITPALQTLLDDMMRQQTPSADHVVTLMQDAVARV